MIKIQSTNGNTLIVHSYGERLGMEFINQNGVYETCTRHYKLPEIIQLRDYLTTEINKHNKMKSENTSKSDEIIQMLQTIDSPIVQRRAVIDFIQSLLSENEKYKQGIEGLESDVRAAELNYDKLKSENKFYIKQRENIASKLRLIPNCIYHNDDKKECISFDVLESFIKKALAKERESGIYEVRILENTPISLAEYNKERKAWNRFGVSLEFDDTYFYWISPTPFNLEVGK